MPKIEKDKPLPDHTKLDYDECYAKVILEDVFPTRYANLLIEDKPDLIDNVNCIGVEVTNSVSQKRRELLKLWYMIPYIDEQQKEKNIERMRQLGVEYTGGIQSWPSIGHSKQISDFFDTFEKKVQKLNNSQYVTLERYDLFVISELFLTLEELSEMLIELQKRNISQLKYSYVYLFYLEGIVEFDLKKGEYRIVEYGNQYEYAEAARKMVEKGEEDDQA